MTRDEQIAVVLDAWDRSRATHTIRTSDPHTFVVISEPPPDLTAAGADIDTSAPFKVQMFRTEKEARAYRQHLVVNDILDAVLGPGQVLPVAQVIEQLDGNEARVAWLFNPVADGETLLWNHGAMP